MHNLLRYQTSDLFVALVCDWGHRRLKHGPGFRVSGLGLGSPSVCPQAPASSPT